MFMTNAARNTLTVMGEQGIRRIVVTSAQGAGDDWAQLNPLFKAFINLSNVKASYEDHHRTQLVTGEMRFRPVY
jgi:hypothetical protein